MQNNSKNSHLFPIYFKDFHPLLIKYGFTCDQKDIISDERKIKIIFKMYSRKLKDIVVIEFIAYSMTINIFQCSAYISVLSESVHFQFNWLTESKKLIIKKFEENFILKLIQFLSFGLNEMPEVICLKIIDYLSFESVIHLSQTNSFWYKLCGRDSLWKRLFRNKFSINSYRRAIISGDVWKNSFKWEYRRRRDWDNYMNNYI